jgi:hypothetical protein
MDSSIASGFLSCYNQPDPFVLVRGSHTANREARSSQGAFPVWESIQIDAPLLFR